jgi:hypothetical protein
MTSAHWPTGRETVYTAQSRAAARLSRATCPEPSSGPYSAPGDVLFDASGVEHHRDGLAG